MTKEDILKAIRDKGYTKQQLCDELGVHRTHIYKMLNGTRPMNIVTRRKLARKLDIKVKQLNEYLKGVSK